ncbi:MAG TPA: hypothetical protein DEP84_07110, partial [Chloroflexi bacterium]|nr:hypothetical protein [Chloroflexota bacterium]
MRPFLGAERLGGAVQRRCSVLVALLLAALLHLARADRMSLWIDEIFTLRNAGQPSVAAIVAAAAATERRPPLSFLVFHLWLGRFPNVEFA